MKLQFIAVLGLLAACTACTTCSSSTISKDQYIKAMVALGCKDLMEGNAAATEVLKQEGVSEEQLAAFRKKTDFKVIADAAAEIAQKVYACHGVNQ